MTPEHREQYRTALIRILAAAGAVGMSRAQLLVAIAVAGFVPAAASDLDNELDYLAGKHLAARMEKTVSPEIARWKITAEGRDYAAKEGLA